MSTVSEDGAPASRILVVDDSESTRYVISTWLRREGYDVVEAVTGTEALNIAATEKIDMAVLDVNLPDMTGYAVCENIKANSQNAVPVLHVSATAIGASDRSEGLRRGADGYLVEPVEREELLASVAALLRGAASERTARRLVRRLRQLNDASLAVNEARTLQQLVATIANQAYALFNAAAWVALHLDDVEVTASCDASGAVLAGSPHAELQERAASSEYAAVALDDGTRQGGLLAVRAFDTAEHRAIFDETMLVLLQFGRAASTAVKNMVFYDIERRIAVTLQQSLLPDGIPEIPGIEVAMRYRASAEHAEVGGDFYEIFSLGDERVAVAVGDVAGHSLEAAAIMAQLRTGFRAYMLEGHDPAATIERLNRMLQRFHPGVSATVCCAVYDSRTGECELANAGHPPALVVCGEGASFQPFGGTLLGIAPATKPANRFTLEPGDVLLLYTDGLIERRRESIDQGLARLERSASAQSIGDLDAFCDRLLAEVGPDAPVDDIALVAIRRTER
jgi:serine phosphatase RsbU (regulator of sigma subunit)/DNA-binding response OmpR family regulator